MLEQAVDIVCFKASTDGAHYSLVAAIAATYNHGLYTVRVSFHAEFWRDITNLLALETCATGVLTRVVDLSSEAFLSFEGRNIYFCIALFSLHRTSI
jgi:hypothetical protein